MQINRPFQHLLNNTNRFNIVYGGAGSGKCLELGTEVILYDGNLKKVEELTLEDRLLGIDGKPKKIIELHSGVDDLYEVKQNKGISYTINSKHILTLKKSVACAKDKGEYITDGFRRPNGRYKDYSDITNISVLDYLRKSKRWKKSFYGYIQDIEFEEKPVLLEPYYLGVWLGDGSNNCQLITNEDQEIIDYLVSYSNRINHKCTIGGKKGERAKSISIHNGFAKGKNYILNSLREYSLLNNKHIPYNYKITSRRNRLELLAGLIDTDGTNATGYYSITQKNKKLIDDIAFLVASLGFRYTITEKICTIKKINFIGTYYNISIMGDIGKIPCKIKRKQIVKHPNKSRNITSIDVSYKKIGKYYGFSVEDSYFLLKDFTVLHNSVFTAQKILLKCITEYGHKWLVIRKVARTIRFSVWSLITSLISEEGLSRAFTINKTDFRINCINGNEIIFLGLDDVEKLKSIHGITEIWIEEASEITEDDFKQCNLRVRGKTKIKKQIILTFNPISHLHWLKKYFFDIPKNNCTIHKSTYLDNAFIDDEYKRELEDLKNQDKTFYQIYALGEWGIIGNIVFSNYVIENWELPFVNDRDGRERQLSPEEYYDDIYQGMDFGFNHPSAFIKIGIKDNELWIYDEFYRSGLTNSQLIEEGHNFFERRMITADSAEPDRIMEFRKSGLNCRPAQKGKHSIDHGIDFMRRFRIHIHKKNCPNTANEFQMFKYKEDKNGNVIDGEYVNFFDDAMAAIRYALEPFRLQRKMRVSEISAGAIGL